MWYRIFIFSLIILYSQSYVNANEIEKTFAVQTKVKADDYDYMISDVYFDNKKNEQDFLTEIDQVNHKYKDIITHLNIITNIPKDGANFNQYRITLMENSIQCFKLDGTEIKISESLRPKTVIDGEKLALNSFLDFEFNNKVDNQEKRSSRVEYKLEFQKFENTLLNEDFNLCQGKTALKVGVTI